MELLGADCDYYPNPLNGTLQQKGVFAITFLIAEFSSKQPFNLFTQCVYVLAEGSFFHVCPAPISVPESLCVFFFPDFHISCLINVFDSNVYSPTLIKTGQNHYCPFCYLFPVCCVPLTGSRQVQATFMLLILYDDAGCCLDFQI